MKASVILVFGTVLLGSGAGAFAEASYGMNSAVVLAADNPADSATHDEYMRKAQDEFQSWRQRMNDWSAEAKAKGGDISQQARENLNKAWSEVQVDWKKLQGSAPSGWDRAHDAFDEASRRLKSAWEKIQSES